MPAPVRKQGKLQQTSTTEVWGTRWEGSGLQVWQTGGTRGERQLWNKCESYMKQLLIANKEFTACLAAGPVGSWLHMGTAGSCCRLARMELVQVILEADQAILYRYSARARAGQIKQRWPVQLMLGHVCGTLSLWHSAPCGGGVAGHQVHNPSSLSIHSKSHAEIPTEGVCEGHG